MTTSTQSEHLAYADLKQLERLRGGLLVLILACLFGMGGVMLSGIGELGLSASGLCGSVHPWATGLCWFGFGITALMSMRLIAWGGLYANRNMLTSRVQFVSVFFFLAIASIIFVSALESVSLLFGGSDGISEDQSVTGVGSMAFLFAPFMSMMYCCVVVTLIGPRAGLRLPEWSAMAAMWSSVAGFAAAWFVPKYISIESGVGVFMLGSGFAFGFAVCFAEQMRQRVESLLAALREGGCSQAERDAIAARFPIFVAKRADSAGKGAN
ncbi:MAG: hypothetical protein EA380_04100 [Phycisphaeraceae bacterium]|nr:MAG: hypothetical protein EA380_04100 [Phycisphaeraceae bacterium]